MGCFISPFFKGNVPSNVKDHKYKPLHQWLKYQSENMKSFEESPSECDVEMTDEQRQRLLDLGFDWKFYSPQNAKWEAKFELLKEFKEEFGDCKFILPLDYSILSVVFVLNDIFCAHGVDVGR